MLATQAPFAQYFDKDGSPLDGGSVYFGVANQNPETQPVQIYWDIAGTQPATQPVSTLNGYTVRSGTPANIYAAGDYSVTVKNRNGEFVYYATSSALFSNDVALQQISIDLASAATGKGSKLVAFIQRLTGAVARWVEDKLSETISVKDFGASTANTAVANNAAIQNAINVALGSARTTLDLGESGDYLITGLTIPSGSQSITIRGRGARLVTTTNAPAFAVTNSDNVVFDGVRILGNSPAAPTIQSGIYLDGIGRGRIVNCHFEALSVGIYAYNANVGYLTGGFQVPSEISGNVIKNCYNGILTEDTGAGHYGEYCRIVNNTITDCQNWGINSHAGNTAIVTNTVNGNAGGVLIYSAGSINGDHGSVVGNTINHNLRCGLYVTTLLRSLLVANNNIWASLGDGTVNGNLGPGNQASSFGAFFSNCLNMTVTGNVFGRNKINVGIEGFSTSVYAHNVHLTDPVNTVFQLRDYTAIGAARGNNWGPNVFNGTWTGGGTDGNPNARQTPAMTNGWVAYSGAFNAPYYWRDEQNVVHLEGLIKSGTIGLAAFTLPLEFRPLLNTNFAVCSNGAFGLLQISSAGVVTPAIGSNADFSLEGVSFRAF